jgi:uncharacterized protein with NAD-binding domain and iron-sulfur cluster
MEKQKKKIAILGGGMSSMTAAWQLAQKDEYDITVYQMGWRLGGKGASGRNPDIADRIEEHGLHVWFGFYENAFNLMRQVYTELGRPDDAPLANVDQAFKPVNELVMKELWNGKRLDWTVNFPENKLRPGIGGEFLSLWSSVELIIKWAIEFAEGKEDGEVAQTVLNEATEHHVRHFPHWVTKVVEIEKEVSDGIIRSETWFLRQALRLWTSLEPHRGISHDHHKVLVWLLKKAMTHRWERIKDIVDKDDHIRRHWTLMYLGCTTFSGILGDNVLVDGYQTMDDLDMVEWFYKHKLVDSDKANDIAYRSAPSQTVYDLFFHYADGDTDKPAISAGIALRSLIKILMGYKGAVLWFMQAGMGDTIFGPMFEVLQRKGVKFKFFHRVTNLGLAGSPGAKSVDTVTISRQVNLKEGQYDPMVMVKGLPCWPSNPLYDQIVEGDELKKRKINLERSPRYSEWKDTGGTVILKAGEDYDHVILGITLAALPEITAELTDASDSWKEMIKGIKTVQTQAIQVWFNQDSRELGLEERRPVVGAYVEPYASLTDFSHLLERENWKANQNVKHLSYTCGVMKLEPGETQENADTRAKRVSLELLNKHAASLWPKAVSAGNPEGLDWSKVVAPEDMHGEERFDAQYIRANIDTNEQYVQSLPRTNQYRIKTDASGFGNLILTGTWIDLGFNIACIEAAAIAGIQAARVLTGEPAHITGESENLI